MSALLSREYLMGIAHDAEGSAYVTTRRVDPDGYKEDWRAWYVAGRVTLGRSDNWEFAGEWSHRATAAAPVWVDCDPGFSAWGHWSK